jgi:hypothetical protein
MLSTGKAGQPALPRLPRNQRCYGPAKIDANDPERTWHERARRRQIGRPVIQRGQPLFRFSTNLAARAIVHLGYGNSEGKPGFWQFSSSGQVSATHLSKAGSFFSRLASAAVRFSSTVFRINCNCVATGRISMDVLMRQFGPLHLHLRPVQRDDAPEASSHLGPVHEHALPLQETHSGPLQMHKAPLQDVHAGPVQEHELPVQEVHPGPSQEQPGWLQVSAIAYGGARSPVEVRIAAIPTSIETASIHRIACSIIRFDKL